MGCQFDLSMCHTKNAVGEEGNRKPHYKVHSLERTRSAVSGFYYAQNRVCNAVFQFPRKGTQSVSPVSATLKIE